MQTDAAPYSTASSHSVWIWGQVASGFSRVWSTWDKISLRSIGALLSVLCGPF